MKINTKIIFNKPWLIKSEQIIYKLFFAHNAYKKQGSFNISCFKI